ncbi:LysR family transcriptional regulator, partial [Klebsiella pneumoniae]|uniref:LysR family transcriptional regulator n=1 Tax=Klebsiella pneumoniae TaxID=573 RepID=UPI002DBF1A3F
MRFNKLDLNLLVALDALLSEQNISRAAEKIHLSQSATSNALARLREYFDDELLVQVGRKMEPTPRAEALKDAVRDILVRVDATVAAQPEFGPAQANRLFRLFVSDYTMTTLIPH